MRVTIPAAGLLEKVSHQCEEAELYEVRGVSMPVRFAAGTLESVKSVESVGRALRVIKNGRLGFSTTTDLTDDITLVENALQSAQLGGLAGFSLPGRRQSPAVLCFDAEVEQLTESELITMGEKAAARLASYDPQLHVEISLSTEVEEVRLLNTHGLEVREQRTSLSVGIDAARVREGDILIVSDSDVSRRRKDVSPMAMVERLIERLGWSEKTTTVQSKTMPVVFYPRGAIVLLLPLMAGLSGRNVSMGSSPLRDKLGQEVFASQFTLLDDGRLDYAARSATYDDEGTPTSRKALIEDGVVRQFMYNLKTAGQVGAQPTGNGFKSGFFGGGFSDQPGIAPCTWCVRAGERSLSAILGRLPEALLVEQVIGLGQGNVTAGEFSNNVSLGFLARRGEIVGRVKNTMIAGNVYYLLRERLIALSDRAEWAYGVIRAPAIALDGVSVASSA
jgi:PmbA protein